MSKMAIWLLFVFRSAQLFILGWLVVIVASVLPSLTWFKAVAAVAFLVIGGVLWWMAQQIIQDVKRWDTPSPGD